MPPRIFEEELSVRCSQEPFDAIKSRLLEALKNSSMVTAVIDCTQGVDQENEYNLEPPKGVEDAGQKPVEVNKITVSFSIGADVKDLDKLSDEVYSCVLYALDNSQDLDFFSLLSPVAASEKESTPS